MAEKRHAEYQYLDLLQDILDNGKRQEDKGTGDITLLHQNFRGCKTVDDRKNRLCPIFSISFQISKSQLGQTYISSFMKTM
jgi:hypothetical protein